MASGVRQQLLDAFRNLWSSLRATMSSGSLLAVLPPEESPKPDIRGTLPLDLTSWKHSLDHQTGNTSCVDIWNTLQPIFAKHGLSLWRPRRSHPFVIQWIDSMPSPNGYFHHNHKSLTAMGIYPEWDPTHGAHHAARSEYGDDYVISVMAVGTNDAKGLNHLKIIRRLSMTYPDILLSNNHILPLSKEILLDDIVFAVFPMLQGVSLYRCFLPNMPQRSVEDGCYLLLQALEAISYLHSKRIAHRDLFFENFLVEWTPESMTHPTTTRPRVYVIDFETAVEFAEDVAPEAMVLKSDDWPFPEETYSRDPAPELDLDNDYCPFKLDMWQFGHDLVQCFCSTTIPELDSMWLSLVNENPSDRPSASELLHTLRTFVNSTPPQKLQITYDYIMEYQ